VIKLAKYNLSGDFLGMQDLGASPFFCDDTASALSPARSTAWLRFGHGTDMSFPCDLASLLQQEQAFYDPYILDTSSGALYPIAVLNRSYRAGGGAPNANTAPSMEDDDVFSRRFFWFDVASGVSAAGAGAPEVRCTATIAIVSYLHRAVDCVCLEQPVGCVLLL
jgi:Meckelin (Transmembrane protein 67)